MKTLLIFFLIIITQGCIPIFKSKMGSNETHNIKLYPLNGNNKIIAYNENVRISCNTGELAKLFGIKDTLQVNKISPVFLESNLQFKTDIQESLFPIVWQLLLKGNAEVYDIKNNEKVKEIVHVKINDVSGEQEYFKLLNGTIFLNMVKTLGE